MNRLRKLRAGSLQFVVFIGAVIAVLLLGFVLISHSHLFFHRKANSLVRMVASNDAYLQKAMNSKEQGISRNLQEKDKGFERDSKKSRCGIFEKHETVANAKSKSFITIALTGGGLDSLAPALYLRDSQRPLIVAGNTSIEGPAALPEQGIRPGNIAGNAYTGSRLLFGKMLPSNNKLPALSASLTEQIKELCWYPTVSGSTIHYKKNTAYQNSFAQPTINIVGEHIHLSQTQMTGNIIIVAKQELVVAASAVLTDIILVAPKITIENGVKGNFQAFASQQLSLGRNCQLDYPSALVLMSNKAIRGGAQPQQLQPQLDIAKNSIVKGVVLYLNNTEERLNTPQLRIDEKSTVTGQVYCEGNLELRGTVHGAVYTHGFMAVANGSFYHNHLFNGKISLPQLSPKFVGLEFQHTPKQKAIAKWLY